MLFMGKVLKIVFWTVSNDAQINLINTTQEMKCTFSYIQQQQMVYQFDLALDGSHQLQQSLQAVASIEA